MDTRNSILDAGEKVFAMYGFDKASVDDIAKAAKTAKGTLYYHFGSKDDILLALVERGIEKFSSVLSKKTAEGKDPAEKIDILIAAQLDYFFKYRDFCRILLTEIWRFEDKWNIHIKQIQNKYLKIIKDTIGEGIEAGQFNNSLNQVFSLISLASLDWAIFHPKRPKSEMVVTIKTVLKKGLLV
jgi:AcrR family transcriptional regulator